MSNLFEQRRRQPFVSEAFYMENVEVLRQSVAHWKDALPAVGDTDEERRSLARTRHARQSYELLSLRFTAGVPFEELRDELPQVIDAYECAQCALEEYEQIPEVAPLGMGNIGDYERCMQLIGLCYLLHRRDLLPRLAALQDPAYIGSDALYEDLLRYGLSERPETDEMLHIEAYDLLLGAIWEDSDEEASSLLNQYVEQWYPHFKYTPWHDGHLEIMGTEGYYFGYWAFEAGAVALLCDIDDSQIDHIVYPKDLVTWARQHAHLSATDTANSSAGSALRCEAD